MDHKTAKPALQTSPPSQKKHTSEYNNVVLKMESAYGERSAAL